ncbi:hypothetical protein DUNSADRAFT_15970 [Dunaliella salina]|uniref:Uncharacterized protein n=1 Tax=Dunaliella salina TaxID=3046 RepID=A0ABQ7G4I6_DUNSA|nr:hypothetical protein DUNSADRAFT_15970 [Dunaliella salina]|eukprot:KAF5829520.1 hypothetical protein DUNSADRAFT_15970 [Dunaliella salina]
MLVRACKLWERLGQTQRRLLACGIGGVAIGAAINTGTDEDALNRLQGPVQEAHRKAASWVEALNPANDDPGQCLLQASIRAPC